MNQFVTRKGFLTLVRRRIALNFSFSKHNECLENKNLRALRLKLDSSKTPDESFGSRWNRNPKSSSEDLDESSFSLTKTLKINLDYFKIILIRVLAVASKSAVNAVGRLQLLRRHAAAHAVAAQECANARHLKLQHVSCNFTLSLQVT